MFRFQNDYPATVWAMIEWFHPDCPDGGNWEKAGWWKMEPGEGKVAFAGNVSEVNRFWYFHAHAADGAHWSGPFNERVPPTAFNWCEATANTRSRLVGMREVNVGDSDSFTLRLTR